MLTHRYHRVAARHRLLADALESRLLLSSTFWVSPTGNDANPGTQNQPVKTIQSIVASLQPGDTLNVLPGTYAGFVVGWDDPGQGIYGAINGTSANPITIQAAPGSPAGSIIINSRNAKTADGIDLENSSYIIIQGFTVNNASGTITRAGIRSVVNTNVTIRNNVTDHNGTWGIFTGFSQNVTIEGNTASNSQSQHGIYVSNSADNPIIRNNLVFGNHDCGIQINADASQGGDGIITNALIEGNIIHDNGAAGGSAINLDGVQNSRIQNNILYNNHASGISLYQIDAAAPGKNDLIVNNTILMPAGSRWALNIVDGSTGATIYNNILLNDGSHGAINMDAASLPGLSSDYNIVQNLFTPDDGDTFQTLAQWQSTTGQDAHSFIATAAQLFVNAAASDFHLSSTSPAIDAGTNVPAKPAPTYDQENNSRPAGATFDIGAYEFQGSNPTPAPPPPVIPPVTPDKTPPTASVSAADITTSGGTTYTFTVTFADNVAIKVATLGSKNILVTAPNGFSRLATLVSMDTNSNGTPRTATYQIQARGGTWDFHDNGTYSISLRRRQVSDTAGNFAKAVRLGTFKITIPRPLKTAAARG